MKNKLTDLNNYLFEELERLMDDEVCHDENSTQQEITKSGAIVNLSKAIIDNSRVQIVAVKFANDWNYKNGDLPDVLKIVNRE